MSFLNKLIFWRKEKEMPEDELSEMEEPSTEVPPWSQGREYAQEPRLEQPMQQMPSNRNEEIVVAKLDVISAKLDSLNQRLANLERYAAEEEKKAVKW